MDEEIEKIFEKLEHYFIGEASEPYSDKVLTLACGSIVTELVKGKTIWKAKKIYPQSIINYLGGLPVSHLHCAVLAVQALHKALDNIDS